MCSKILGCVIAGLLTAGTARAQRIPADYNYRGLTFTGTLFLPSTAVFTDCHFVTDSVVLERSFGAVFRNCTFESRSKVLYLADQGDGMVMADCQVTGPEEISFARTAQPTDRNYVTGLTLNGHDCGAMVEDSPTVIELDGLEMGNAVRKPNLRNEVLFARITKNANELTVTGLDGDMFVGLSSDNPEVKIGVTSDSRKFIVYGKGKAVVTAVTEYGIEAAIAVDLK